MRSFIFFIFMIATCHVSAQNLYVEDFEDLASGTIVDNGPTAWTRDLRNATLGNPDDHFEVRVNNGLTIFEGVDVDGAPEWISQTIDISALDSVQVFVDVAELGALENNDLVRLYYVLDGVRTQFALFRNDFGNVFQTASSPTLSGNTLQVVARIRNNADDELIAIDNIVVTGVGGTVFSRQTGNWNDPNSWSFTGFNGAPCGCFPGRSTSAIIGDNDVITVSSNIDIQNLTIQSTGSLVWGGTFEIDVFNNGVITVESGGSLDVSGNTNSEFDLAEADSENYSLVVDGTFIGGNLDLNGMASALTISGSSSVTFQTIVLDSDNVTLTNNLLATLDITGDVILDANSTSLINNQSLRVGGNIIYFNLNDEDITNASLTNSGSITLDGDLLAAENNSLFTNAVGATFGLGNIQTFFGTSFTLNNSGTINLLGDISQTDVNGTFNNLDGGVWNYAGAAPDPDIQLFADNPTNVFRYNGVDQTIITPVDAYHSLSIAGSGVKSTIQSLDINGDLSFESSGTLDMTVGQNDLSLAGNWTESGTTADPFVEGQRMVTLDGATAQTLEADTLFDLTINKSAGDVTLNQPLGMVNRLLISSATVLNTNNQLTLISTSDGEAGNGSIGPLASGANVSGDVNVQRYMSGEGRIYRYLASPVTNTTVASWQDDFPITGTFDNPSSGSVGGVTIRPNIPSLYFYNETPPGDIQQGWVNYPGSGTAVSNPITVGTGYAAFVREATAFTTIDVIGPVYQGDFNFNVAFTNSGSPDDGWNLLGNPYPSPIDWTAPGWTKVGLADAVYIRDNGNATVATYVNGVGTNGGTGRIATGQAFWVQSISANPVLSISENSKSTRGATFFRTRANKNLLRITLSNDNERDEVVFRVIEGATEEFEPQYDARKLENNTFNLSFFASDKNLVIHSTNQLGCNDTLRLNLTDAQPGKYQLDFSGIGSFYPQYGITLVDAFDTAYINISDSLTYNFEVFKDERSQGAERFSLVFEKIDDISFKAYASTVCKGENLSIQIPDSKTEVLYSVYNGEQLIDSRYGNSDLLIFEIGTDVDESRVELKIVGMAELCSRVSFEHMMSVELSSIDLAPPSFILERCGAGVIEFDFASDYEVNWYSNDEGETPFLKSESLSSRIILETDSFYVSFVNDLGCESSRSRVTVMINKLPQATVALAGLNILKTPNVEHKEWYYNNTLVNEGASQIVMDQPGTYSLKVSLGACSDSISYSFETPVDKWFDSSQFHPNPVQNYLYIRLVQDGANVYTISDSKGLVNIFGQLEGVRGEVIKLEVNHLTAGYHFLQINDQKFRFLKL